MSNVLIQVMSPGHIRAELALLFSRWTAQGVSTSIFLGHSGFVASDRNEAILQWLDGPEDWLIQIDHDVIPPANIIEMPPQTLEAMSRIGGISGAACVVPSDIGPVVAAVQETGGRPDMSDGSPVACKFIGTGCWCLHRETAQVMINAFGSLFKDESDERGVKIRGEDAGMCLRARELGIGVWLQRQFVCAHGREIPWAFNSNGDLVSIPWGRFWNGRLTPNSISSIWHLYPSKMDLNSPIS